MPQNNCAAIRAQLSAYLDGELDAAQSEALLAHLSECADCTTFYNTLRKTLLLYRGLAAEKMPDASRARLLQDLDLD
jgi:predicted anti-sigma-YlaC factor YlaD